jgi:hypothetical protein
MYRKAINGVLVRDANIRGPRMVNGQPTRDRDGRVLYADTILANGNVVNNNQRATSRRSTVALNGGRDRGHEPVEDYNYTISSQLNRRFSDRFEGRCRLHVPAVQGRAEPDVGPCHLELAQRPAAGRCARDLRTTTSVFERPHRVLAYGTYTLPWRLTDVTLYYEGTSGRRSCTSRTAT